MYTEPILLLAIDCMFRLSRLSVLSKQVVPPQSQPHLRKAVITRSQQSEALSSRSAIDMAEGEPPRCVAYA